MQYVFSEIDFERQAQDLQWGGPSHDDLHTKEEWIAIMVRHLGLSASEGSENDTARFRKQMIRLGALVVAAVESLDRRSGRTVGANYIGSGH